MSGGGNEGKLFAVRYDLIIRLSLNRSTCLQVMSSCVIINCSTACTGKMLLLHKMHLYHNI